MSSHSDPWFPVGLKPPLEATPSRIPSKQRHPHKENTSLGCCAEKIMFWESHGRRAVTPQKRNPQSTPRGLDLGRLGQACPNHHAQTSFKFPFDGGHCQHQVCSKPSTATGGLLWALLRTSEESLGGNPGKRRKRRPQQTRASHNSLAPVGPEKYKVHILEP